MVKKRFNKKGQDASKSYEYLMWLLLIAAIAAILFLTLRSIGNAALPK